MALFLDIFLTFGTAYNRALTNQPFIVKSITAGFIGALGNIVAQKLGNRKGQRLWIWGIFAQALYTFFVGAPLTQYFIYVLHHFGPSNVLLQVLIDNFVFGPLQLILGLYLLPRIEGSKHYEAMTKFKVLFWDAFVMSLQIWIPCQTVNFNYVPLEYRVLFVNLVSFGWTVYLSMKQLAVKSIDHSDKTEKAQ